MEIHSLYFPVRSIECVRTKTEASGSFPSFGKPQPPSRIIIIPVRPRNELY